MNGKPPLKKGKLGMKRGQNSLPKMTDEVKSMAALKSYLCNVATGGLQRPQNKRVEAACAACQVQCGYGAEWLKRFWAEEDRKWEREHRDKEKEEEAIRLARLKGEYEAMRRERDLYEQGNVKPTSFLHTALKPRFK